MASRPLQDIVCCLGESVAGNPTQFMMERALEEASLDTRVLTLEVAVDDIEPAMQGMRAMRMRGALLLPPHRAAVNPYLDCLTDRAQFVGEVNLVVRNGQQLEGDHIVGTAVRDSLGSDCDLASLHVTILGAGAAARSVAIEFASHGANSMTIVNRTSESGTQLVETLGQQFDIHAEFKQWVSDIRPQDGMNVVVLAAAMDESSGRARVPIELDPIAENSTIVDMRPSTSPTRLIDDCQARNLNVVTGLDVQISEASIAFYRWTGIEPNRAVMRDALEEFLLI